MKGKYQRFLSLVKKDPITLFEMIPELERELALVMLDESAKTLLDDPGIESVLLDSDWFREEAEAYEQERIDAMREER